MRRGRVGRNEPCWCHSGKKYKKCHLERDSQPPKLPWEIAADLRRNFEQSKYCAHALATPATCKGTIVKAHSIPRGAGLKAIAENGHVVGPDYDYLSLVRNRGELPYDRIGINKASTFTGFCQYHDATTFSALENQPLIPTAEQCFLMGYRAICREQFHKRVQIESIQIMRETDRGKSLDKQETIQQIADFTHVGTLLGLADITHHKRLYDAVLTNSAWDQYQYLIVELRDAPQLVCTGAFAPEFDFLGRWAQDPMDTPPTMITVTLLPFQGGAFFVFGWEADSDRVCRAFAQSFRAVPKQDAGNALVRLMFEFIENIYARPSWWESLPELTRKALVRRLRAGADPNVSHHSDCLKDDGIRYVDWAVSQIFES